MLLPPESWAKFTGGATDRWNLMETPRQGPAEFSQSATEASAGGPMHWLKKNFEPAPDRSSRYQDSVSDHDLGPTPG